MLRYTLLWRSLCRLILLHFNKTNYYKPNHFIMRKFLLIALVALLAPVLSTAQTNKAVQRVLPSDYNTHSAQSTARVLVPLEIMDGQTVEAIPANATTNYLVNGYTLGAWVKLSAYNTVFTDKHAVIFGHGGTAHFNTNGVWNLLYDNSGALSLEGWGLNVDSKTYTTTKTIDLDTWYYFTMVIDNANLKMSLYINGQLYEEKTMARQSRWFTEDEDPALYFGGQGFAGLLDEVHVFSTALTAAEVATAAVNPLGVSSLVGYYTLDEVTGTGQFANHSTNTTTSSINAVYDVVSRGTNTGYGTNGPANVAHTEGSPTLVESDRVIADFETTLTIEAPENGKIEVKDSENNIYAPQTDAHTIMTGTVLTVTATPADGYVLDKINVTSGDDSFTLASGDSFTVTAETHISANFLDENDFVTINIVPPTGGGTSSFSVNVGDVTLADGDKVLKGSILTFSNDTSEGYELANYTINGLKYTADTYTVKENTTISAAFNVIPEAPAAPEYCEPAGTTSKTRFIINSIAVSDNKGNSTTIGGSNSGDNHALYKDRTNEEFTTEAGATITLALTPSANWEWIHNYVYIDFGQDGTFNVDPSNTGVHQDIVSHTGYSIAMKSDNSDTADPTTRSNGTAVTNNDADDNIPSFTLPSDMEPGKYRIRLKVDWNSIDPCGRDNDRLYTGQATNNGYATHGTPIIDFTIVIPEPVVPEPVRHDLSVAVNGDDNCTWIASSEVKDAKYNQKTNQITYDGDLTLGENEVTIKVPAGELYTTESMIPDGGDLYFFTNSVQRLATDGANIKKLESIEGVTGGSTLISESLTYEENYWDNYKTADPLTLISNYKDGIWYFYSEAISGDVAITLNFDADSSAIDGIATEEADANAPVEYFNLQGVKVSSENLAPGFYIVRQGTKASKVYINK